MTEPSIFVILVPNVLDRRAYFREVVSLNNSSEFLVKAISLLEGSYLGRKLSESERERFLSYLQQIW